MSTPTTGTKRTARVTANLRIPVPGDDDPADLVEGWGKVADETDARVTAAIAEARAAGARPARTYAFMMIGA